jgi:tetratricopeptide (TPR) repeat protein
MSRWLGTALICLMAVALTATPQQPALPKDQREPKEQQEQAPPEEDETLKVKEYSFNPLAAEREVRVGNFYFHKGKYKAAAERYREATKWNTSFAEAYFRLGEAEEKQKAWKAAREAYEKYLELAGDDDKRAGEIRKKVARLAKSKG